MADERKPQPILNHGKVPPPPTLQPHHNQGVVDKTTEYLVSRGWRLLGIDECGLTSWEDPRGTADRVYGEKVFQLPTRSGGKENVTQRTCPPVYWTYGMNEAVGIQRVRDLEPEKKAS